MDEHAPDVIVEVRAMRLRDVPMAPPPFRSVPDRTDAILLAIRTTDGRVGWGMSHHTHEILHEFMNTAVSAQLIGMSGSRIEQVRLQLRATLRERRVGVLLRGALSLVDIALWDLQAQRLEQPLYRLLGGARSAVDVYVTHGAAYGDAPPYSLTELADEAAALVAQGITFLKTVVGRDTTPDVRKDIARITAIRERIGPDIRLAIDAAGRTYDLPGASRLLDACKDLDLAFFEEPIAGNRPEHLRQLRARTLVPIAAAETPGVSILDLLTAGAVDIVQPNVNNDGGYTRAREIAALADSFGVRLGHGNGGGPHNVALQAGVANGNIVEYHYHRWQAYDAIFAGIPQPSAGVVTCTEEAGIGFRPRPDVIIEHAEEDRVDGWFA